MSMRRFGAAALISGLLLSGCGSKSQPSFGGEDGPVATAAAAPGAASPAAAGAVGGLEYQASLALGAVLPDPAGARFLNVRPGWSGAVCGEVDARQSGGKYGGYRPFVVTPERIAAVSATSRIGFDDPDDTFPDLYMRWCATPEELKKLEPVIANGASVEALKPFEDVAEAPAIAAEKGLPREIPIPDEPAPAVRERPARPGAGAAPPSDEESFFNAVIRKSGDRSAAE